MGVKLSDVLLKAGLAIVIVVSIILSFLIWTNNARYERNPDTKITTSTDKSKTDRKLSDIYLPSQILQKNQDQAYMVYNHRENPNLSYKKQIKKWQIQNIQAAKVYDSTDYLKLVNQKHQIQLVYPDELTWRLFRKIYSLKDSQSKRDFSFSRIIMNTNNKKLLYLTDDSTRQVRTLTLKDTQVAELKKLLKGADLRLPVEEKEFNGATTLFYTQSVEMTPYSYLISRENINNYISTLLSDASTDASIEARESGNTTTYYKGLYKKLALNASNDQVQFEDYTDTLTINSTTELLENSYKRLLNVGNSLTNVRYFGSDPKTQSVAYYSYVEGFPVFNQAEFGNTTIQLTPSGQILRFSSRSLQVPVPAENQESTLPPTQTMLDQLSAHGVDVRTIKGIQLGYRWVQSNNTQQVIDLKPTYYIYLDNAWKDYTDLLSA